MAQIGKSSMERFAQEELPPKMLKPLGQRVTISASLMLTMPEKSYKTFAHRFYHLHSECSDPFIQ
jgi:hypothetical protein